ncbi:Salicylic acid-binding protein 2 [Olea europaea subsp. europaea]|uniref:Salicylic acid-binding protein 2 n=1 Tax=Olea europaea subsp. europaea TaxID=158383 RepID=A0A8S0VG36_OLEEU|nr:Salicylic acid-binding protein 2 [Olea europaea subsp. europaea]
MGDNRNPVSGKKSKPTSLTANENNVKAGNVCTGSNLQQVSTKTAPKSHEISTGSDDGHDMESNRQQGQSLNQSTTQPHLGALDGQQSQIDDQPVVPFVQVVNRKMGLVVGEIQ